MDSGEMDDTIKVRLAAGDPSALDLIWSHYSSDLYGYLVSIHCSRHEAEDSLQDLFITISQKRHLVAKAERLKPYLFRMARNVALNRLKRAGRIRQTLNTLTHWLVGSGEDEVRDSRTSEIEAALAALPEKQRSVIVLKFYDEKTLREIGEMLDISENTAGSRYRYGMAKLRHLLQETSV